MRRWIAGGLVLALLAVLPFAGGCELVVSFDRSKIVDGGPDGGTDGGPSDGGTDASMDGSADAASPMDAGTGSTVDAGRDAAVADAGSGGD